MTADHMDRRAMLRTAGVVGVVTVGGAGLAACGSGSGSNVSMPEVTGGASTSTGTAAMGGAATTTTGPTSGSTGGAAMGGSMGTALGATSEIPNGGGKIFQSEQVVVTQPSSGEYKAFTAVCTHQQCLVNEVSDGVIKCPCHGSEFSAKDGSVVQGPAMSPLASKNISVSGGRISLEA